MTHLVHAVHARRGGFALPMVFLVIGFLTAGGMAAFARATAEVRIVDSYRAEAGVFASAQAGLERYMAKGQTTPWDTVISGDSVRVRALLVRAGTGALDTAVYVVRATSIGRGGASGVARARRSVAQYAYYAPGKMQVMSSWTSLSGIHKNGVSGIITGADPVVNSDTCGGGVTKPGVAVPTGGYTQTGGTDPMVTGDPPIQEMGTQAQMSAQVRIDWEGIVNPANPSIRPRNIECVSGSYGYDAAWFPCNGFPTAAEFANPSFWPVVVINGSASLPRNGRGVLIVTGDLTLGGGDTWDGILLVGGRIVDNGDGDISGAVVTGLNVLIGHTVGQSSRANGTKDYQYDSCKIRDAARGMATLAPLRNAWVDNWRTW